jgi:hypothetical protein
MNNLIVNILKSQCSVTRSLVSNKFLFNQQRILHQNLIKRNFAAKPKEDENKNAKPNCNVGKSLPVSIALLAVISSFLL